MENKVTFDEIDRKIAEAKLMLAKLQDDSPERHPERYPLLNLYRLIKYLVRGK